MRRVIRACAARSLVGRDAAWRFGDIIDYATKLVG